MLRLQIRNKLTTEYKGKSNSKIKEIKKLSKEVKQTLQTDVP